MERNNKIVLIFLILAMILTGYLRDFLFLNVNEQVRVVYYKAEESFLSPSLSFLESFSYAQLYYGKWLLTLIFALVFMGYSCLICYLLFRDKIFIRRTIITYAAILSVSALFFIGGYLSNHPEKGYRFARLLMGLAQSPVILMALVPAFYLFKKGENS